MPCAHTRVHTHTHNTHTQTHEGMHTEVAVHVGTDHTAHKSLKGIEAHTHIHVQKHTCTYMFIQTQRLLLGQDQALYTLDRTYILTVMGVPFITVLVTIL